MALPNFRQSGSPGPMRKFSFTINKHRWKKPGILGAEDHLTADREYLTASRDLLVAWRFSLAAIKCSPAAGYSLAPRIPGLSVSTKGMLIFGERNQRNFLCYLNWMFLFTSLYYNLLFLQVFPQSII